MGAGQNHAAHTEYWLQRWIAVAESIGISKSSLLQEYYFDEFLAVLDEYNDMHSLDKEDKIITEVGVENW